MHGISSTAFLLLDRTAADSQGLLQAPARGAFSARIQPIIPYGKGAYNASSRGVEVVDAMRLGRPNISLLRLS